MTNNKESKTYQIEIIETLSRVVEIVAEDDSSAILKAKEKYRNEDIVLYPDDVMDTEFIIY